MPYRIELPPRWIDGLTLEQTLGTGPGPLANAEMAVSFAIPAGAKLMVDASVRLLSMANQLQSIGKRVALEFCPEDCSTHTYLDRIGFFDALHPNVDVTPERPAYSAAFRYQGLNSGLVEIARIRPGAIDKSLPSRLETALVGSIRSESRKEKVGGAVFTLFSELVGNVYEHSRTQLEGYAVLQVYKNGNGAKIAVSDSGEGLLDTLRPSLPAHYPRLVGLGDTELLIEAFRNGISRHGKGHGAGLRVCADHALKLAADLEVRLPVSYVRLIAKHGVWQSASARVYSNMPLVWGTHIAFDFRLD